MGIFQGEYLDIPYTQNSPESVEKSQSHIVIVDVDRRIRVVQDSIDRQINVN